jgi:putative ABC transport system permease protein
VTARPSELAREAAAGLAEAGHRSAFALVGLALGIGAVVALTSVTAMARRQAIAGLRELGTDVVAVTVAREGRAAGRLQAGDARALASNVPALTAASPVVAGRVDLRLGAAARPVAVLGVTAGLRTLVRLPVAAGRFFSPLDRAEGFCVLGAQLGARAGATGGGSPIGRSVEVGGKAMTVIGVLGAIGDSPALPFRCDDAVLVPLGAAGRLLGRTDPDMILARLDAGADERVAAAEIRRLFALTRPGLQVEISSPEAAVAEVARASRLLAVLLAAVGSISLLLGAVGVMNVMAMAVTQRRREIGVRRSLGASRRDVWLQFLVESVTLAVAGGAAGAVGGALAAAAVAQLSGWPFAVSAWGLTLAVGVSVAVGVAAGLFPAHLATRVEPVAALRE